MGCKRLLSSTVAVPYVLVSQWSIKQWQLKLHCGIFNSVDPIVALVGVVVRVLKKEVNTFYSRVIPQAVSCLLFTLEGCVRCQSSPCVMCGGPNCKERDFGPRISSVINYIPPNASHCVIPHPDYGQQTHQEPMFRRTINVLQVLSLGMVAPYLVTRLLIS